MGWYQRRVHGDTDSTAMVSSGAALAWLLVVAIALVAHGESEEIQTLRSVSLGESADMEEYTTDIGATSRFLSQANELIRAQADRLLSQKMVSALKLLSDEHELGESGPTQKASIFGYLSSLAEVQKQCPASRLQCPSSSVAENVPQQPKKAPTKTAALGEGEEGEGERGAGERRRRRACKYHLGLAAKSWMKPYRKAVLDSSLRNIMHNGVKVDCNPASCDNPSVCGIPPCRGVTTFRAPHVHIKTTDYWKAIFKRTCPAAKGCNATTEAVNSDMPSKPEWSFFLMTQPATRVGIIRKSYYTPGVVYCCPKFAKTDAEGCTGSWMWPGAGNCNPYELMACTKGSIAHINLPRQHDKSHRHSALLFVKRTWCIKGECGSSDCPARCYTSKRGQCVRFDKKVMPKYQSRLTRKDSQKAYKELVAGRFSTKCTPEAARAARAMLAGN